MPQTINDTSLQSISMYLSSTWKAIFDGIDRAISQSGTNFTLVTYGEHNFVEESKGTDGQIDANKLCINIGNVVECDPLMKDLLVEKLVHDKISFAAVEALEPNSEGKDVMKCYFAIDRQDKERALSIISDLNQAQHLEMEPEELWCYCQEKQSDLSGISRIEPEIYDVIKSEQKLNFPYTTLFNRDGSVELRVPSEFEKAAQNAIIDAVIICSARTREAAIMRKNEHAKQLTDALSKATDNYKPYIIIDSQYPDHFIKTDSKGIHSMIHNSIGDREIEFIDRTDPRFQNKAYDILRDYAEIKTIPATDKDMDAQLEAIRSEASKQQELPLDQKVEYYKRSFVTQIRENIERGPIEQETEEQSMTHQPEIAKDEKDEPTTKEKRPDLSELSGEQFRQEFCSLMLGASWYKDPKERQAFEAKIMQDTRLNELSEETQEVKIAVINEINQSVEEIQMISYDFREMELEEYSMEITNREKDNGELHIEEEYERT